MSSAGEDGPSRGSVDFVQSSIIEAIVPSDPTVNLDTLLREWDGQEDEHEDSLFPFVEQRHFVLLGKLRGWLRLRAKHLTYSQACR